MADPTKPDLNDMQRRALAKATDAPAGIRGPELVGDPTLPSPTELDDRWRRLVPPGPGKCYWNATIDQLDDDVREVAEQWTTTMDRPFLLLGPVGTGKTHAALAMARHAHTARRSVRYLSVAHALNGLRPEAIDRAGALKAWQRATTVDVLVLDDLGREKPSEWTREQLFTLIDHRYNHGLATLATSNLDVEAAGALPCLGDVIGTACLSRLMANCLGFRLEGDDRRTSKG